MSGPIDDLTFLRYSEQAPRVSCLLWLTPPRAGTASPPR